MRFACGCSVDEDGTRLESCPKPGSSLCTVQPESDHVNHPAHYGGADNPYEAIKVIEAWGLSYCLGNALKYICRADHKGSPVEDLQKAIWFINREIERRNEQR